MSFQKINSQDTTRSIEQVSIMAYGYNEKELKILNDFCHKQSINNMIVVNNEILDMTLEDILSGTVSPSPSPPLPVKAIIMNGFSGSDLQSFLKGFKSINLERPIFATVTPTSKTWSFKTLINELIKEHNIMKNRNKK